MISTRAGPRQLIPGNTWAFLQPSGKIFLSMSFAACVLAIDPAGRMY